MGVVLKNNAVSTITTVINASDVGIAVSAGTGALFPAISAGSYFYATLISTGGTYEIVKVTARVGDTMTIVRAQEGTTAQSFASGSRIEARITAASITDLIAEIDSGIVNAKQFGAVGDGVTDDTVAIQAAFNSGATTIVLGAYTYLITNTVTLPNNVNIDFGGGELLYAGPRDRVAFQVGTTTGNAGSVFVQNVKVRSSTTDWTNTAYIGIRVCSARRANINVVLSSGFTIGFEAYSNGGGYAYNYHLIQHIVDNKYAMVLTNDGAASYINENIFMGGRYGNTSSTNSLGSSYGVWVRVLNSGYQASNMNRWIAPCFEMQDGAVGDTRVPIWFDNCGQDNTVINARYETGRGTFALMTGTTYSYVVNNRFEARVFGTNSLPGVMQTGNARQNLFVSIGDPEIQYPGSTVSYDVFKAVKAFNATNASISNGLHFGGPGNATPLLNATSITQRRNSVSFPISRNIGFFAKVTPGGSYVVSTETDPNGGKGRIYVNCYDANFTLLTGGSDLYRNIAGDPNAYNGAAFGGAYEDNADGNDFLFQLSSNVHFIRVCVANSWLQSIRLQQLSKSAAPIRCFSGLETNDGTLFSGISPATGINGSYARGEIINNAVAASGQPSYWQCVTTGRLAPAWAPSTAYVVGAVVLNDTNRIYACTTAGTSAGAGGPTGSTTGTSIPDGTAVWTYLVPQATFVAGANLP
jgi:hypothetical protein